MRLTSAAVNVKLPKRGMITPLPLVSYLANGGGTDGGNHLFKDEKIEHFYGPLDIDVFQNYLKLRNPVIQGIEDRIIIIQSSSNDSGNCNT